MILSLFFKIWSVVLGSVWSYLDDYLVSPLAKPAFILGLIYAVINWKVVPFAWHVSPVVSRQGDSFVEGIPL